MSGYHRISKLKSCIHSLNSLKNLKKLNDSLGKQINSLCSNSKNVQNSTGYFNRIKELNRVLTQEFNKISADVRSRSSGVINIINENVTECNTKLKEGCKPLFNLPDAIEEKKVQYKHKHLKPRHIRKEAEKLCQYLTKHQTHHSPFVWGAAGLTLSEVPESLTAGTAAATKTAEKQAATVFSAAENISVSIEAAEESVHTANSPVATVLDKDFTENLSGSQSAEAENTDSDVTSSNVKDTDAAGTLTDAIPEPPPIPDATAEVLNQLNALGEPTFASLGLGGWTPVGIVQHCMEFLHVTLGIEWWAAIVFATICIRIMVFPLVVLAQRNAAKMHNNMPQMQLLQLKMTEARQTGDAINAARYGQEMMLFMNEKGLSPFKNMIVPLAQAPIFISFFMGLRQMANVPVESLTHGGLFWFTDLTLPDQYFLLPVITSTTLWLTIELGTDGAKLASQNMQMMKYVLRAIPVIILPFTVNFPGVILCYWVASNFISLGQVAFLKIPRVREFFKIEKTINHKQEDLPVKPKGFKQGLKDSWTNVKLTKELEDRRRMDEIQFQRAGKGPIQKTYKYDPTKQSSSGQTPISAKKR